MTTFTQQGMPTHQELVLPVLQALVKLGGSASSQDIITEVTENYPNGDELLEATYPKQPSKRVFEHRTAFARSTAKQMGAIEQPTRGMNLLTNVGERLLRLDEPTALQEIQDFVRDRNRAYATSRKNAAKSPEQPPQESSQVVSASIEPTTSDEQSIDVTEQLEEDDVDAFVDWRDELLNRLHQLTPEGFEKFVIYLLQMYDLKLEHRGGTGDEGVDAIGRAPISPVLSSRVAVQIKRYDPNGKAINRETVALFQRDAQAQGAERAILVTLSRFTDAARRAAISFSPTVDLIGGKQLTDLILAKEAGVKMSPVVDNAWFDRFD